MSVFGKFLKLQFLKYQIVTQNAENDREKTVVILNFKKSNMIRKMKTNQTPEDEDKVQTISFKKVK